MTKLQEEMRQRSAEEIKQLLEKHHITVTDEEFEAFFQIMLYGFFLVHENVSEASTSAKGRKAINILAESVAEMLKVLKAEGDETYS